MTQLRAIVFDVDGTLAETERDGHRVAFNRAFAEHQISWNWGEALYGKLLAVTGGKERMQFYIDAHAGSPIDPALIPVIHATKTAIFQRMAVDGQIPLRPGVEALVDAAHAAGIRLAVATTTSPGNVEALLHANLNSAQASRFGVIASGDSVKNKKPAPDIYLSALSQLQLSAAECVAIEDSGVGLRSASGAGIATLVTPSHYTAGEDFSAAASVVGSLADVDVQTVRDLLASSMRP
jgi:HAD superfamily hydrolase (TIGR01509 family)